MDFEREYSVDEKKETEGAWIDHANQAGEVCRLLVASTDNKKYQRFIDKQTAIYQRGRRGSKIPEQKAEQILSRAMAKYILLGWEEIEMPKGTPLPYSEERAYELLLKYKKFRADVLEYANNEALFKAERDEEIAKNLESGFAGS